MLVDRLTVMNDIFNSGDKKRNHRRSLNKSLKRLSQRSSVKVPVDRLTVMNDIFNDDRGISEWRDEEMPAKRWSAKKKRSNSQHRRKGQDFEP